TRNRRKDEPDAPSLPLPSDLRGRVMNVAARLGGFAVTLALVFAAAAFAGSRIDAHPGRQADRPADEPAMGAMRAGGGMAPQAVRGLAVSDDGLTLRLARTAATPGTPFRLAFRI